jgi:ABC-type transport system involved in cytochrome c biogenesis permease component
MTSRIVALLHSTSPPEMRRVDVALLRLLFLAAVLLCLLPAGEAAQRAMQVGPGLLQALYAVSQLIVLFLALRLGGDSVGDLRSGLLELLFLTGTTPRQWLLVRVLQMWKEFLSVWIVAAPVLALTFTLGGVTVKAIVAAGLLLATGFLVLSSLALLASIKARSRNQIWGFVVASVLVWELLLKGPNLAAGVLGDYYLWPIPAELRDWLESMSHLSIFSASRFVIYGVMTVWQFWPTFTLYGGVSALLLGRCWMLLKATSEGRLTPAAVESAGLAASRGRLWRPSRRCWDDALAWQAYCVHGLGLRVVRAKCVIYVLLAGGLAVVAVVGDPVAAFILAAASGGLMLLISVSKPGDCMTREVRDETLPMLLLTPHDAEEFFAGWQRGALRLAWPDIALFLAVAAVSLALDPISPLIVLGVGGSILCSAPFLMLWGLVPFSADGFATGVALIFVILVLLGICIVVSVAVHPALFPVVSLPSAYLFNFVLRKNVLPYWMQRKIGTAT